MATVMHNVTNERFTVNQPVPEVPEEIRELYGVAPAFHRHIGSVLIHMMEPLMDGVQPWYGNMMQGIYNFSNASVIFVNEGSVEFNGVRYGSAYGDYVTGSDLVWNGQYSGSDTDLVHNRIIHEPGRVIHFFTRRNSSKAYVYRGLLTNPRLLSAPGTSPRVQFTIQQ